MTDAPGAAEASAPRVFDPLQVPLPEDRDLATTTLRAQSRWWTVHPTLLTDGRKVGPCFYPSPNATRFAPVLRKQQTQPQRPPPPDRTSDGPEGLDPKDILPVVYAASNRMGAVAEVILRNHVDGGSLSPSDYIRRGLSTVTLSRDLKVLQLHSGGLYRARVHVGDLTAAPPYPDVYARTRLWAQTAHDKGWDGVVWMSRLWNTAQAILLFQDRCQNAVTFGKRPTRVFSSARGADWLTTQCATLNIDVLGEPDR